MIQEAIKNNDIGNLLDLDWDAPTETPVSPIMAEHQQQGSFSDLLSIGNSEPKASSSPQPNNTNNIDDIMNLFNTSSNSGTQNFVSSPQQQQQQQQQQYQQQNLMSDFTNDLFGSAPTQSPVQQQSSPSKNTSTNDPFADLF